MNLDLYSFWVSFRFYYTLRNFTVYEWLTVVPRYYLLSSPLILSYPIKRTVLYIPSL